MILSNRVFLFIVLLSLFSINLSFAQTAEEYISKGNQMAVNGDNKGAIESYKKAIAQSPSYAPAYYSIAFTYQEEQNYKDAAKYYSKVIELEPNFYAAYYARAICESELLNHKAALSDLNIYIENKKPNIFIPYSLRGYAKKALGNYKGAIEDFNTAISLSPQALQAYVGRAISEFKLGQTKAGCKDMKKAGDMGYVLAPNFLNKYCKNKL